MMGEDQFNSIDLSRDKLVLSGREILTDEQPRKLSKCQSR